MDAWPDLLTNLPFGRVVVPDHFVELALDAAPHHLCANVLLSEDPAVVARVLERLGGWPSPALPAVNRLLNGVELPVSAWPILTRRDPLARASFADLYLLCGQPMTRSELAELLDEDLVLAPNAVVALDDPARYGLVVEDELVDRLYDLAGPARVSVLAHCAPGRFSREVGVWRAFCRFLDVTFTRDPAARQSLDDLGRFVRVIEARPDLRDAARSRFENPVLSALVEPPAALGPDRERARSLATSVRPTRTQRLAATRARHGASPHVAALTQSLAPASDATWRVLSAIAPSWARSLDELVTTALSLAD